MNRVEVPGIDPLPERHRVYIPYRALVPNVLHRLTPVLAITDLIRHEGYRREDTALMCIDPMDVWDHIASDLKIRGNEWPLSLQDVIDSLLSGCGTGYLLPSDVEYAEHSMRSGIDQTPYNRIYSLPFKGVSRSREEIKEVLRLGVLVACGVGIHGGWHIPDRPDRGRVEIPVSGSRIVDGIALVLDGWDDSAEAFSFTAPYGEFWGEDHHGWLPYGILSSWGAAPELVAII